MRRKELRSSITVKGWWNKFFLLPIFSEHSFTLVAHKNVYCIYKDPSHALLFYFFSRQTKKNHTSAQFRPKFLNIKLFPRNSPLLDGSTSEFEPEPRPHRLKRPFETLETAFQVTCQVRFQAFGWLVVLRARGGYSERKSDLELVYLNSRNIIRLLL